jgi:hypothetical protein
LSPLSLPEPLEQALPVSEAVWSMECSVSVRRAAKQKNAKKAGGFLVFAQKRYLCGKVFWGILRKKRIAKNSLKTGITNVSCAKKRVGHACICPRMVTGSPVV